MKSLQTPPKVLFRYTHPVTQQTPLLIYGASAAALGMSIAKPQETLILERTAQVAREYVAAFRYGNNWQPPHSEIGQALHQEMIERNLLSAEGKVHLPPLASLLFNFIKRENLPVQFMTRILQVQPQGNGFEVTCQNVSGIFTVHTDRIIDTTSRCESKPDFCPEPNYTGLNALLYCKEETPTLPQIECDNATLQQGRFAGEVILRLQLDGSETWPQARQKMHHFWQNRPQNLQYWTLAAIGDCLELRYEPGLHSVPSRWDWFPSCAHDNALQALDAGFCELTAGGNRESVLA